MKTALAPTTLLACLGLLLQGCVSTQTPAAAKVKVADARKMKDCTLLGEVTGTSGATLLPVATESSVESAQNDGADKAAAMGATHVVWGKYSGGQATTILGNAYKCPEGTK
jgi:hypothetical protein